MLLIVYVDDMKLSGPADQMEKTWKALGDNITLEIPKGNQEGEHTHFLGAPTGGSK